MTSRSQYRFSAAAACIALGACSSQSGPAASGPSASASAPVRVAAIERVYGDLARQIGGDDVAVTTLLDSPTADPHEYEPTTLDAGTISEADIVIENGLGYDAFADKLIAASPNAARTVLNAGTLGGHRLGDNPHVWYETRTLRRVVDAIGAELAQRKPAHAGTIARRTRAIDAWIDGLAARLRAVGKQHAGTPVAITEPVFDYILNAASLDIATPKSFSHAIEEGSDPAPQDVDTMQALLSGRHVKAFVYNSQTVETSTTNLLATARSAGVTIVPVTETLPANTSTQNWMDGEVSALVRAL
jgi:zinc/manganese transport system substrate-binding protein